MTELEATVAELRATVWDMQTRILACGIAVKAMLRVTPEAVFLLRRYIDARPWKPTEAAMTEEEGAAFWLELEGLLPPE